MSTSSLMWTFLIYLGIMCIFTWSLREKKNFSSLSDLMKPRTEGHTNPSPFSLSSPLLRCATSSPPSRYLLSSVVRSSLLKPPTPSPSCGHNLDLVWVKWWPEACLGFLILCVFDQEFLATPMCLHFFHRVTSSPQLHDHRSSNHQHFLPRVGTTHN